MTIFVHYELSCDEPECFSAYQSQIDEVDSRSRTWKGAQRAGWIRRDIKHYCPTHAGQGSDGAGETKEGT